MFRSKLMTLVVMISVLLFSFTETANAAGQNITICSIDTNGRGSDRTLNGTGGVDLRAKLLNASNFSPAMGIEPISFSIVDGFANQGSITVASLISNGCEVFFKGFVPDGDISQAERTAMQDWVEDEGGTLLSFAETSQANAFAFKFGHGTSVSTATSWTANAAGLVHPIFNGPFGTASVLNTANQKTFYNNSTGATILATDTDDTSEPTVLDRVADNGHAVFLGDVDVITTNISSGDGNNTDQDHFTLNLFAYVALTYNQNNFTPAAPSITSPTDGSNSNDATPTVSGTADPGATITVTGPNGETCTTVADAVTGAWSCELSPALADGENTLTATATFAGNTSSADSVDVTIDTTSPTAPTIDPINENTNPVTGTAEPGATINLSGVVCDNAPVMADAAGNWSCDVTSSAPLTPGDVIEATATDDAGNESLPASAIVGNSATESVSPTVNPVAAGATEINGTAEPGSTIDLAGITCSNAPVVADASGQWVCESPNPVPATGDVISVTATQDGLLPSPPTTTTVFDPNVTAPPAPQVDPTNGDEVTGTTIPNGEVTILDDMGNVLCTTTADAAGNFTCSPLDPAPEDGDVLNVVVADDNGNSSLPTQVTVDATAPTAPTIDPINENTNPVTGTAEPGATINLSGVVCDNAPVMADAAGNWSCDVTSSAPLTPGDVIEATATDDAGNESLPASAIVGNSATESVSPTVNPVAAGATEINGTAEPGSTIDLAGITCSNAPVVADASGQWVCESPNPVPATGDVISVTATQDGLLPSPPTTTTVFDPNVTAPPAPQVDPTNGDEVTGTTIPNGEVTILDDMGNVLCTTTADAAGNFTCSPLDPAPEDGDVLNVVVADDNGNSSLPTQVTVDAAAPDAPMINDPSSGLTVSGTGEPGATVTVTTPSGATCTAEVQDDGSWSCDLSPEPVDGETASAIQEDLAGNESMPATATVAYAPDLSSFITNCVAGVRPDEDMLYEINIMNAGNIDIAGAAVTTLFSDRMSEPSWVCQATGGAICDNTTGNGDLNELVDLPAGSSLAYLIESQVTGVLFEFIDVETTVTMPAGTTDTNISNNTTFDSDLIYQFIFKDGFECALPGTIETTNALHDALMN